MKKLLCSVLAVLLSIVTVSAEERVIDQSALPKQAQAFIAANYPQEKVSIATMERGVFDKDYKVILSSGVKIEFDGSGSWIEIESKGNSEVSTSLLPTNVAKYIKTRFPDSRVQKVEKDKKFIEVELDNKLDLKFNSKGDLVELDS